MTTLTEKKLLKLGEDFKKLKEENKKLTNIIEELWGKNIDELHEELKKCYEDRDTYYERYNNYRDENIKLKEEIKLKDEIIRLHEST